MLLSTCQLPSCNLFTQHGSYLSWRDTTSELWTMVHYFSFEYKSTAIITLCIFLQVTIIIQTIHLILCFQQAGEFDNLTVTLGESFLVVLCRLTLSIPTGSITLVSKLRETCFYTHHTFLSGSPKGRVICTYQALFLASFAGEKRRSCPANFNSHQQPLFWRHCQGLRATSAEQVSTSRQQCLFSGTVTNTSSRRHIHQAATRGVSHFQPFYLFLCCLV